MADINSSSALWKNLTSAPNFSNATYTPPFDNAKVLASAIILITFMVIGIIGNTITITVLLISPNLRNIFNYFILSLCFSDLISACISWINLYRRTWGFDGFNIPNFFCALYWGADVWTSYVTAMHVASFASLRLVSIWKPYTFNKIRNIHCKIWICCIWFVAFGFGFVPMAYFRSAQQLDRYSPPPVSRWPQCTQNINTLNEYKIYAKVAFPIFLYFPAVIVILVTIATVVVLKTRKIPGNATTRDTHKREKDKRKEKQAIIQLLLIVGSFLLGYVPFTAFEFHTLGSNDKSAAGWRKDWLFGTVQYMCLRLSECLNPIFYNLASPKMRNQTKKLLTRFASLCRHGFDSEVAGTNSYITSITAPEIVPR